MGKAFRVSITPESILSSVVVLTEQRSQKHLEDCLTATLADLAHLRFCGICTPMPTSNGIFIDWAASRSRDGTETCDELQEIGTDPLLLDCMALGTERSESFSDGSVRRAHPVVDDHGKVCAFLVTRTNPGQEEPSALIKGFVAIYRNYLAILWDAARDTLTGLKNRKTFDENFSAIVTDSRHIAVSFNGNRREAHLDGQHHWLGIIDIDHFKAINDTHGHVFGDEVLLLLSALMRKAFRSEDKLFRFGGEEFVVLLAPTTFAAAQAVFERFRATVAGFAFPQVGHITVSAGFVRIDCDDLPPVVIGNADRALYYAKAHGRDQVRSFEQLVADGQLPFECPSLAKAKLF
ncbi:diguanylate cyclase/phosphodiesterase (GGDEF & EAL domains) with PAS/PAC sensor(s) [Paramagnetospirillum magnetotacticum MS-1]|uniref:diguanylate cyclase n=1 Tax=Paramagnetospirillum magnetotacticum MS-1 TaxID=272627 RepID=A0A0C2YHR1_PARME|nr:diguanylate cyclase/phosphodiesterase (GGDEF & EAL domains) with PAS/PAC sensor(s) [Paramagnetospirillum magnetotacticum MS-1]